ncbi:2-amino-4-hydroxy-6-hydroxymethyldihydropteridine diphosphokinase [marine bacterium AO1-C]|nr:2-amino-4-hydroxy-6-hydroxymethyldihydropteridine diphosphokinase [marine bacterium AO1-C]
MHTIYLLLGTNLGEKAANLNLAKQLIEKEVGQVLVSSSIYETMPWGIEDQPIFYNQVLKVESNLEMISLLKTTQSIEQVMGRKKYRHWGERLIDIDILYIDDLVYNSEDLNVPHLQIPNRRFTLVPLVEIAPDFIHPVSALSQTQLLTECPDKLEVKKVNI